MAYKDFYHEFMDLCSDVSMAVEARRLHKTCADRVAFILRLPDSEFAALGTKINELHEEISATKDLAEKEPDRYFRMYLYRFKQLLSIYEFCSTIYPPRGIL